MMATARGMGFVGSPLQDFKGDSPLKYYEKFDNLLARLKSTHMT